MLAQAKSKDIVNKSESKAKAEADLVEAKEDVSSFFRKLFICWGQSVYLLQSLFLLLWCSPTQHNS